MAHRPASRRSAAQGISTGVTSRGTPGRAAQGGQPVVLQVVPVYLQAASPLRERQVGSHLSASRTETGGRKAPWRHNERGAIPPAFIFQRPSECSPAHVGDGSGKMAVPHQAPHVQVLHHDDRLGFRQPCGELVQEVPADVPNPPVQPGQAQGRLLVVPLPLPSRLRIPLYNRGLLLPSPQPPRGLRQRLRRLDPGPVRVLRSTDLPGLRVRPLHLTGGRLPGR